MNGRKHREGREHRGHREKNTMRFVITNGVDFGVFSL
jgi:hypothetical protein